MANSRLCSIPDCGKPVRSLGWCNAHHIRWLRNGDPLGQKPPPGALEAFLAKAIDHREIDCLIWPYGRNSFGYAVINKKNGRSSSIVSRVVCEAVHGQPPTPKHQAAHSCGKGLGGCVSGGHLSWKTRAENEADKIAHSTSNRGERCGTSRLKAADIVNIRRLKAEGMKQADIARLYGTNQGYISQVVNRVRWGWLDG